MITPILSIGYCRAPGHLSPVQRKEGKATNQVEENRTNQDLVTEVEPDLMADVAAGIDWVGAYVFVLPDSSIRFAEVSKLEKTGLWTELGDWVQERRVETTDSDNEATPELVDVSADIVVNPVEKKVDLGNQMDSQMLDDCTCADLEEQMNHLLSSMKQSIRETGPSASPQ